MLAILRKRKNDAVQYPREFWLLFWGVFFNRISASIIWPFLTVYMSEKLGLPLIQITLILSLRAFSSMISTAITSPIMDRLGRKGIMLIGLLGSAFVFFGMAYANTVWAWVIMVIAHGAFIPIFNTGVNAMVADTVTIEKRVSAYALIRAVANAGIAIGPVLGGILATYSFELAFITTGICYLILTVLIYWMIPETMPKQISAEEQSKDITGYGQIFRDWRFIAFVFVYFLLLMAYTHIFTLLPVYVKENFGLLENQYSLIVTLNAGMVVFLQYSVTHITKRFENFSVIIIGSILYALGLLTVAYGSLLGHFMISMAILTLGELLVSPTATTLVANIAPEHMRARYLGLLALGDAVGSSFGPVVGGYLNDAVAPVAMWYGAAAMAAIGAAGYFVLSQVWYERKRKIV